MDPVRADILQRFDPRQRMQARLNIRAAKLPEITQALIYGLDLLALTPLSPPTGILTDDGGAILLSKTPLGNWSSDGTDTAPIVGPYLFIYSTPTTETVDGESDEGETTFPPVTQDVTFWTIEYWEDGAQDGAFNWQSETLLSSLAEDIFAFRYWSPVPNTEDTTLEDDSVPTQSTVWLQPVEPDAITIAGIPGLSAALAARLEFIAVTSITDAAMLALGFTDQIQITADASTVYLPVSFSPWS